MSNKRSRERNEDAEYEPDSKKALNDPRQTVLDSITSAEQSQYADSGVNLTYAAGCTEEENYDTVTLKDIIGDEHLQELYQFNFTVDLHYLMENLAENVKTSAKIKVIHGMKESIPIIEATALVYPNVEIYSPKMMDRWGVHHSKCMILLCQKDSIRYAKVAVVTANICHADWNQMCQATYRTPVLPLKSETTEAGELIGSEHGSPFERDLISYFGAYNMKVTNELCEKLRLYDFSKCKAVIIASVPGYHQDRDSEKWGLKRLQHILTKKVDIVPECQKQSIILTQASSIGKFSEKWYTEQFAVCMRGCRNPLSCSIPQVKFIYPTIEEVCASVTGLESAGFLRMDSATYEKLHSWFPSYLCRWEGKDGGRQKIMPHYKSYTRLRANPQTKIEATGNEIEARASIAWHLVTSANLSRAAWGDLQKNGTQLHIRHYELGILLYPDLWEETHMLAANHRNPMPKPPEFVSVNDGDVIVPVRIPYGIPPKNYTGSDHCWTTAFVE
ncbi:tyrosyl-DNA phosphodiesterase I [Umbelopsis sp. AD052]|nr:tyrosyl-DNA phosphodiesterase I [Umbelopsis sp. AD052]